MQQQSKQQVTPVSCLETEGDKTYVAVHGQPYLMYGVQLRLDNLMRGSFSATEWALAEPYFKNAVDVGFKTVLVPIPWSYIETTQGIYDFAPFVDPIIDNANKYNLMVQILWFGSAVCGWSFAPSYVTRDSDRYPRHTQFPEFLDLSHANLLKAESAALAALMDHIADYDVHHRIVMVQIENEPDVSGPVSTDWNSPTDMAAKLYAGAQFDAVNTLINALGGVVHASRRNVVTRANIGTPYRALDCFNARWPLGTGCDIYGVDSYAYTAAETSKALNAIPSDTPGNVPHQPEGGGQFKNLVNLILSNFEQGGGFLIYELRTIGEPYDLGIFQKVTEANRDTWLPRTGKTQVPYALSGDASSSDYENMTSEIQAFNELAAKADKKIALTRPSRCAAFNAGNASGTYSEQRVIADIPLTFYTETGGEAFVILDTNGDLILMNLKDGSRFVFDPSFVQRAEASVGCYNQDNVWVEESTRAFHENALIMRQSEVICVTLSP